MYEIMLFLVMFLLIMDVISVENVRPQLSCILGPLKGAVQSFCEIRYL